MYQLVFDDVLDFLHGHLLLLEGGDRVGDLGGEDDVLSRFGHIHRLENGGDNLLVVEFDVPSVALKYTFDHSVIVSVRGSAGAVVKAGCRRFMFCCYCLFQGPEPWPIRLQ